MQFVAASKLKRAQDATLAARPYSEKLDEVLADLASVLGGEDHPLLATARGRQAPDRADHDRPRPRRARSTRTRSASRPSEITEHAGRPRASSPSAARAATRCAAPGVPIEAHFEGFGDRPTFADVLPLARLITDDFLAGTYSRVDIVYSRVRLDARPSGRRSTQLLPIEPTEDTEGIPGNQFIFEPSPAAVLEQLAAALRRDAPLPGRPRERRRARSRAGWSR